MALIDIDVGPRARARARSGRPSPRTSRFGPHVGAAWSPRPPRAVDVPGFDNSAMDGYAVRAADTAGAAPDSPRELRLAGESRAGHPAAMAARSRRGDRDLDRGDGPRRRRRGRPGRGHRAAAATSSPSPRPWRRVRASAGAARTSAPETSCSPPGPLSGRPSSARWPPPGSRWSAAPPARGSPSCSPATSSSNPTASSVPARSTTPTPTRSLRSPPRPGPRSASSR